MSDRDDQPAVPSGFDEDPTWPGVAAAYAAWPGGRPPRTLPATPGVIPPPREPLDPRARTIWFINNLIAAIVNATAEDQTLTVEVDAASGKITETVRVPAHTVSSLGENVDPIRLDDLGVKPGLTVPVYFQSGDAEGAQANLPVLGGDDEYLSDLVPEPAATPTPIETPAS